MEGRKDVTLMPSRGRVDDGECVGVCINWEEYHFSRLGVHFFLVAYLSLLTFREKMWIVNKKMDLVSQVISISK